MSSLKKKIKTSVLACLSLTLCATLTVGTALAKFDTKSISSSVADSVPFTDVTGQFDTTELSTSNFNSSVLEGTKTANEIRTLIISLSGNSLLEAKSKNESVAEFMDTSVGFATVRSIDEEQKSFINKLNSRKIKYTLKQTYSTIANAVAIEANTAYISEIKDIAGVESVVIGNTYLAPQTVTSENGNTSSAQSDATIVYNDSFVYPTGIYDSSKYGRTESGELQDLYPWGTGEGTVVAVIDTGLDYTHNAFNQPLAKTSDEFSKTAIAEKLTGTTALKRVTALGGTLTADDVYVSEKVPFAFDYADTDADVYPSYSNHGTHVAGIIAGNDPTGYDDKNGNHINETFKGVAPDAQLVICKTFTDNLDDPAIGGAESENIMAALEDCVTLGVDVINMSLGTTAGFTTSDDDDDEGKLYNKIFSDIQEAGISLICAASNDYSAGFGSVYGTNLATNPDSGTVGSPSTYYAALSVASISGQQSQYMLDKAGNPIFFENSSDGNSDPYDFVDLMLGDPEKQEGKFEYVVLGSGQSTDYAGVAGSLVNGRIALIQRGGNTFQQKVEYAVRNGASGVIIYNNVPGTVRMSLGDISDEDFKPAVSISMEAGAKLVESARSGQNRIVGEITISRKLSAGPFMSAFSSWGTTPDLKIKPEITAHGGEITSTVPGGYAEQSGTSMASPNMAGLTALVRNYVKTLPIAQGATPSEITQLTNQLILSTATTAYDESNLPYSPRKQGSGLANLDNIIDTRAYVFTDKESDGYKSDSDPGIWYQGKDGRPKIELGDGENNTYTFSFKVKNFDTEAITFTPQALFMTEQISNDKVAVLEKAEMLDDIPAKFYVNNSQVTTFTVPAGQTTMLTVTLELSKTEQNYIKDNFTNGMYVEGFIKLNSDTTLSTAKSQCALTVPFLAFYGDWEKAPMLDYDAFELAENAQDTSIDEDQKLSATVFATQPYASYYNDRYVIPMGSYVYTQDPNPDLETMYTNMEYCAISRYNEYYNDDGIGNYLTTYNVRCVYAGLLRNARRVNYKLYDTQTGELKKEGHVNRISKAYANGGSAIPGYVELKLTADELGLLDNGKYRFDFEFLFNEDSEVKAENTFSFDFYVDYEAPVLQDARLRYYNYRENNKDKQRIYLDLDVYDNHYAQSVMLCYRDEVDGEVKLNLATDYITPVRNPVKNGVTTVSIEVTDFWEEYKDIMYVQLDDYALNHANYYLGNVNGVQGDVDSALNSSVLPDEFWLAPGEENVTVNINEAHKIQLVYEGNADLSNFVYTVQGISGNKNDYFEVRNGEIVGLKSTNGRRYAVTVSNGKNCYQTVFVTVTDTVSTVSNPDFGFNIIRNSTDSLIRGKHNGFVTVNPGEDIQLEVVPDPWYYPMDGVTVTWSTRSNSVELNEQTGAVHTVKKGSATISATIVLANGRRITRNINLTVLDEFTISNMSLTSYHGDGETILNDKGEIVEENVVIIPSGKNIMTISEDAFKNNRVITKVIIPETVTTIERNAFKGCTALKGIYFVSDKDDDYNASDFVAKSDLKLIDRNAFEDCTALEVLDLRNVKVISIAREAFKDCENLKTIVKSSAIGTAYDRAFLGCKSLQSVDLSGLHVAGSNVFSGCENLSSVITDRFTDIGRGMFSNLTYEYQTYDYQTGEWSDTLTKEYSACNSLKNITIKATSVGDYAFANCTELKTVAFEDVTSASGANGTLEFTVGNGAFKGCTGLNSVNFGNCLVRSVGAQAFAGCTSLSSIVIPEGLKSIGSGAFTGTNLTNGTSNSYNIESNAVFSGDTLLLYTGSGSYQIPERVNGVAITKIGAYAFAGSNVTSVTIPSTITEIGEGAFSGSTLNSVKISANLKEIPAYAFYNTKITTVALPSTVTYVGDFAFANNANLGTFVYAPAIKAEFGDYVFSNCTALQEVELNANITKMGNATFNGCTTLRTVQLPNLEALGTETFRNTPALEEVIFGAGSTVTGSYTFASETTDGRKNLTTVELGTSVAEIGEYAFFNCANLASINLRGATVVNNYAFYGCSALTEVTGLEALTDIGNYAFADCSSLSSLNLASAKIIGDGAFLISGNRAYNSLSIPVAVSVGAFAFSGGLETSVQIPASLVVIGEGAFSRSSRLTGFTVANGNTAYFEEDGVLYGYIKENLTQKTIPVVNPDNGTIRYEKLPEFEFTVDDSKLILVAYPSAKTVALADGARTYELLENTVKVEASAFRGLRSGSLTKVVLPYGLKVVGASAFYQSGITDYEFKGVSAPVLETSYSYLVDAVVDEANGIRGYYYNNFENDFIFYDGTVSGSVTPLTIHRPDNGTGYDNYVFSNYFGNCVLTGITMTENANAFIEFMKDLPTAQEVSGWNLSNKDPEEVQAFSNAVKTAHGYYNSFSSDESQMEIVNNACNVDDFFAVETALRSIKNTFGIKVTVSRLTYEGDFKTEYKVGETFDKTGLRVIVVYDDFSTEYADMNQVSFNPGPDDKLTIVDNVITVSYAGRRVNIQISVTESGSGDNGGGEENVDGGCGGCGSTGSFGGTTLMTLTVAGLMVLVSTFVRKRKQR